VLAAAAAACWRLADVDILLELLALPRLRANAQAVFERCVARGAFGEQAMIMVMERRRSQAALSAAAAAAAAAGAGTSYPLPAASSSSLQPPTGTLPWTAPSERGGAGPRAKARPPQQGGRQGLCLTQGLRGTRLVPPQALSLGDGTIRGGPGRGRWPSRGGRLRRALPWGGEPGLGLSLGPHASGELLLEESDFGASLSLAEALAGSEEHRVRRVCGHAVRGAVQDPCGDDAKRERILRGLVARATRHPQGTPDCDLGLDILSFLVTALPTSSRVPPQLSGTSAAEPMSKVFRQVGSACPLPGALRSREHQKEDPALPLCPARGCLVGEQAQEEGVVRPVLTLMRESAELAGRERSVVWQQLHSAEAELRATRSEREVETQRLTHEKTALQQKLAETEAAAARLKVLFAACLPRTQGMVHTRDASAVAFSPKRSPRELGRSLLGGPGNLRLVQTELRAEAEKGSKERKEGAERVREMESAVEWAKAERTRPW